MGKKSFAHIKSKLRVLSILLIFVTGFFYLAGCAFASPDKNKIQKDFDKNKENVLKVKDYFVDSEYQNIYITNTNESGVMFTGLETGNVIINNEEVVNAISDLFNHNFKVIVKSNNTIHFQMWANKDYGCGIAYSINGKDEPELDYLTKLEPLSEEGWYYYEEDFNEWKLNGK